MASGSGILDLPGSARTKTNERALYHTETPQTMPYEMFLALPNLSEVGISSLTGCDEYSTGFSSVPGPFISSSQDPKYMINPGLAPDMLARLSRMLPIITTGAAFVGSALVEPAVLANVTLVGSGLYHVLGWLGRRDVSAIGQEVRTLPVSHDDQGYASFKDKLVSALLDEPIEDGVRHSAEVLINDTVRTNRSKCLESLSRSLAEYYTTRPSLSASILRCIGRLPYDEVGGWGLRVVDDALRHKDVEVREAAIRALEAWGGDDALGMLRRHGEPEPWLDDYKRRVIADLSDSAL